MLLCVYWHIAHQVIDPTLGKTILQPQSYLEITHLLSYDFLMEVD